MGCQLRKPQTSDQVEEEEESPPDKSTEAEYLTNRQKELIHQTWREFKEGDVLVNFMDTYFTLFQLDPHAAAVFEFVDDPSMESLLANKKLQAHAGRQLEHIDVGISSLDDKNYVAEMAFDVGIRHAVYGLLSSDEFQLMVEGIINALQHQLKERFTPEVREAWSAFLGFYTARMALGYQAAKDGTATTATTVSRPSKHGSQPQVEVTEDTV